MPLFFSAFFLLSLCFLSKEGSTKLLHICMSSVSGEVVLFHVVCNVFIRPTNTDSKLNAEMGIENITCTGKTVFAWLFKWQEIFVTINGSCLQLSENGMSVYFLLNNLLCIFSRWHGLLLCCRVWVCAGEAKNLCTPWGEILFLFITLNERTGFGKNQAFLFASVQVMGAYLKILVWVSWLQVLYQRTVSVSLEGMTPSQSLYQDHLWSPNSLSQ